MNIFTNTLGRLGVALAVLLAHGPAQSSASVKVEDSIAQRALACIACHGKEGRATSDGYFPRIAGKPAEYLFNQMVNFRDGKRQSPSMSYMVGHMSDEYLREMAAHFASQHPPYPAPQTPPVPAATLARGQSLALRGDASRNIPACAACHGAALTGVLPATPGLVGLSRDYLRSQLGAWKNGTRKAAEPDCMAQLASKMTVDDISAVTAWLASRPVPPGAGAVAADKTRLPVACGSVPH